MDLAQYNKIVEQLNIKYLDEIEDLKNEIAKREIAIYELMKNIKKNVNPNNKKKICNTCGKEKPLKRFNHAYTRKDGKKWYVDRCNSCEWKRRKARTEKNKTCPICNEKFTAMKRTIVYCGSSCSNKGRIKKRVVILNKEARVYE